MQPHVLDPYRARQPTPGQPGGTGALGTARGGVHSGVHRLPAAVKLATAIALVVAIVTSPPGRWPFLAGAAVGLALVTAAARLPARFILRRVAGLEPFVLGVSLLAWLQPDGARLFAMLVVKSTLCLWTMIVLSNTTSVTGLLRVLRRCRVPALLVTTLALMYRYLFVLAGESQRLMRARSSRTLKPSRRRTWQLLASGLGMLFVRSSERAERIYAAMLSRGWR